MEEIAKKFEDLAEKFPEYESDICDAINCIERAMFTGVDKGKVQLEIAQNRLKEIDDLIASALSLENLSSDVNDRLMQCFISIRPRLESNIEQLKSLIENPPKESLFPPIDDSEIYPKENETNEEINNENELANQNTNDHAKNEEDNSNDTISLKQNENDTTNNEKDANDNNFSTTENSNPESNEFLNSNQKNEDSNDKNDQNV